MQLIDRINKWLETIKNAAITLISIITFGITSTGIYNGLRINEISLEEIKVPSNFEDEGYKSEIATIRILDTIKKFQNSTSSAKDRVSFINSKNDNQPTSIELAGTGINIKSIQMGVRDSLGLVTEKINGEITSKKTENGFEYRVVVRKTPQNVILVDFKTTGSVEDVINQTALKILEETDPHIAASYYRSNSNEADALRMIDIVLGNDNPNDDKYSLNLRAYIHLSNKRLELAQQDIDKITSIAPDFIPLLTSKSWMAREMGNFNEALKLAEEQIIRAPEKWWGYLSKAQALQGLKRDHEASETYLKVISMRPEVANPYLSSARYFISKDRYDLATESLRVGTTILKEHPRLNLLYADVLQKNKLFLQSQLIYKKFVNQPKSKTHALIGIGEILKSQNKVGELGSHLIILKKHIRENPLDEYDSKYLSKRLDNLLTN